MCCSMRLFTCTKQFTESKYKFIDNGLMVLVLGSNFHYSGLPMLNKKTVRCKACKETACVSKTNVP